LLFNHFPSVEGFGASTLLYIPPPPSVNSYCFPFYWKPTVTFLYSNIFLCSRLVINHPLLFNNSPSVGGLGLLLSSIFPPRICPTVFTLFSIVQLFTENQLPQSSIATFSCTPLPVHLYFYTFVPPTGLWCTPDGAFGLPIGQLYSSWCTSVRLQLSLQYSNPEGYIGATYSSLYRVYIGALSVGAFSNVWPIWKPPLGGWRGGSSFRLENWKRRSASLWSMLQCGFHYTTPKEFKNGWGWPHLYVGIPPRISHESLQETCYNLPSTMIHFSFINTFGFGSNSPCLYVAMFIFLWIMFGLLPPLSQQHLLIVL
jgi:hypothetical protein